MNNNKPLTLGYFTTGDGKALIGFILEKPGVMTFAYSMEELMININDALACMEAHERSKGKEQMMNLFQYQNVKTTELAMVS